jgi:fatty-acyl-CoA synthase
MDNLMQEFPLRVGNIIDHAARYHPKRDIISRDVEGPINRTNWNEIRNRALQLAKALQKLGVRKGDVIGVMAWNTSRHLEVVYGVPGVGAVNHTLNPRLFSEQLIYIINHAEDKVLMVDPDLIPVIELIIAKCTSVQQIIVMTNAQNMPKSSIENLLCYEEIISSEDSDMIWVKGSEYDACGICYTSGTTGNPKGVVYTHRSNTLHALASAAPDMLGLASTERIMPVVPLFHANGWSIGYTAPITGASMIMPGRDMSPKALYEMLELGATVTAAVPTVWLLLLDFLEKENLTLSTLKRVVIGGSACPRAVIEKFQDKYGIKVLHAWGMTEMSPLGTICSFKPEVFALSKEGQLNVQETTGHPPFSVDLKITNDQGTDLPWDGLSPGKLWARGAAVVKRYLKSSSDIADDNDWFDTGDVATIDPNGYMRITDRSKDVIKSGGEWISSIDLENAAVGHPEVSEAAAIGVAHPKWDERPIVVVVCHSSNKPEKSDILNFISKNVAKWQVPDDVIYMDEIPHTATGKISKLDLRQKLSDMNYVHPESK